jgi:hypothetical protein
MSMLPRQRAVGVINNTDTSIVVDVSLFSKTSSLLRLERCRYRSDDYKFKIS